MTVIARRGVELKDHRGPAYRVGKASLGAIRDFRVADNLLLGMGGLFAVTFIPDGLAPLYGWQQPDRRDGLRPAETGLN